MPTFAPPVEEGPQHVSHGSNPADRLFRHYPGQDTGRTIWKDPLGAYHSQQYPYQGGAEYRTYNDNDVTITTDPPNESLANATEVYMGGSTYPVSDAKATELRAAGFYVGGHWDTEEQVWIDLAIASVDNRGFMGGDAFASLDRGDGTNLWVCADNGIGVVDSNGFYVSSAPTPSALFTRTGTATPLQVYPEGNPPAWLNPTGGLKWWPVDLMNDGVAATGGVMVLTTEVAGIINLLRNEILVLNAFGQVASTVELNTTNDDFFFQGIYKDDVAGFHYILGQSPLFGYQTNLLVGTRSKIARVPIGQLSVVANYQYWDGASWQSDQSRAAKMLDINGVEIQGMVDLTRVGNTYVLIAMKHNVPALTCYKSTNPQGPWKQYYAEDFYSRPKAGAVPTFSTGYITYLPKFHEWMSPANHLVVSYNRNLYNVSIPITQLHVSTFTPLFVYVPTPS